MCLKHLDNHQTRTWFVFPTATDTKLILSYFFLISPWGWRFPIGFAWYIYIYDTHTHTYIYIYTIKHSENELQKYTLISFVKLYFIWVHLSNFRLRYFEVKLLYFIHIFGGWSISNVPSRTEIWIVIIDLFSRATFLPEWVSQSSFVKSIK